jgi:hypothetical protein
MSSNYRYRGGDTAPIMVKTSSSCPIEEGDLVFADPSAGHARTATNMVNQGSAALNQLAFAEYFLGVALRKVGLQTGEKSFKIDPDDGYLMVATRGLFEFDCESETEDVGEGGLIGLYAVTSATQATALPSSQKVMAADTTSTLQRSRAIGVLRKTPASFGLTDPDRTRCLVDILAGSPYGGHDTPGVIAAGTYTNASGQ